MMPLLIVKITVLFSVAAIAVGAMRNATAALRHLVCVCALAGSMVLPFFALFPARVIAIPLPIISAVANATAVAPGGLWSLPAFLAVLWALGCAALIVRLAIGYRRAARMIEAAAPADLDRVYFADVSVPMVCGLFRPAVLMPETSRDWPAWQFDAAVRHERMHVERKDLWTNFAAQLACAMWWFHPLVWILFRRLRSDQEAACDDAILSAGFEPATYAEALLAVARTATPQLLNGCAMTTQTNLKSRITRLLDRSIARTTSRGSLLRAVIAFAIALAAISIISPLRSSAQTGPVYKVGEDVTSPKVIYLEQPAYTEDARAGKISGTVGLSVVVGVDGLAHDINIQRSLDPGLDRNAALAVQKWRFQPGMREGQPVAVLATIEVNYRLL